MGKHTPGPWLWDEYQLSLHNDKDDFVLWFGGNGEGGGTTEENARLIAAAPELLEALVAVLEYCVDDDGQPTVATALAAIAKATGATP